MRTTRWLGGVVLTGLLLATAAPSFAGPEPGRTDGSEGSEYGTGGYSRYGHGGQYFLEGFFGSAQVDVEVEGADNTSQTDLLGGLTLGYQIEDWLSFQVGYGHISDQKIKLYSVGARSRYDFSPFGYFLTLDAGLLALDGGDSNFSVTPGAGVELMISKKLQVGLAFQHDFVMSDDNLDIDRFTARLRFTF